GRVGSRGHTRQGQGASRPAARNQGRCRVISWSVWHRGVGIGPGHSPVTGWCGLTSIAAGRDCGTRTHRPGGREGFGAAARHEGSCRGRRDKSRGSRLSARRGTGGRLNPIILEIEVRDRAVVTDLHEQVARLVVDLQDLNLPLPLSFGQDQGDLLSWVRWFGWHEDLHEHALIAQDGRNSLKNNSGWRGIVVGRWRRRRGGFQSEHVPLHNALIWGCPRSISGNHVRRSPEHGNAQHAHQRPSTSCHSLNIRSRGVNTTPNFWLRGVHPGVVAFRRLEDRNCLPSSWLTPCIPPVYPLYAPCIEYASTWLAVGLGAAWRGFADARFRRGETPDVESWPPISTTPRARFPIRLA